MKFGPGRSHEKKNCCCEHIAQEVNKQSTRIHLKKIIKVFFKKWMHSYKYKNFCTLTLYSFLQQLPHDFSFIYLQTLVPSCGLFKNYNMCYLHISIPTFLTCLCLAGHVCLHALRSAFNMKN